MGEEVSHFYHPTPPPARSPSGFWRGVDDVLKMREGTIEAVSSVFSGNYATPQDKWEAAGYAIGVPLAMGAQLITAEASLGTETIEGLYQESQRVFGSVTGQLEKWGFFAKNGVESLETGGRQLGTVAGWNKAERQASQYYKKIRSANSNTDVASISKNTGIPEYRIQRVKEHLFFNEHTLSWGKVGRFDPYIEIADSWERLQAGSFVQQDLDLLNHEYFESRFEALYKTDYSTAHNAAIRSGRDWSPDHFVSTPEMTWRP